MPQEAVPTDRCLYLPRFDARDLCWFQGRGYGVQLYALGRSEAVRTLPLILLRKCFRGGPIESHSILPSVMRGVFQYLALIAPIAT